MAYVDDHLQNGETVVHRSQYHWFIYFWPAFVMWNGMALGATVPETDTISIIIFLLGLLWLVGEWIAAKSSDFAVTNRRLIIKTGLLRRRLVELNLAQVASVSADQGIVGRALNFGNFTVQATSGSGNNFMRLRDPVKFKDVVQEQTSMIGGNASVSDRSEAQPDPVASLEKLARLRADGALTEDEFETQKAKLLA